jgi:uncharacterized membrane protein
LGGDPGAVKPQDASKADNKMSMVYIGYSAQAQQGKVGQTCRPISKRAAEIRKERHHPDFKMLYQRSISEIDRNGAFSVAIEGHMRAELIKAGFQRIGNDHFVVNRQMLPAFEEIAKKAADAYIEWAGIAAEPWG